MINWYVNVGSEIAQSMYQGLEQNSLIAEL